MAPLRTVLAIAVPLVYTTSGALGAEYTWERFVGSYICSVEKMYNIDGMPSDPTRTDGPIEVIPPKVAMSFAIKIAIPNLARRRLDCATMAKALNNSVNDSSVTADWGPINADCHSVLNLTQNLNNGFGAVERDYHIYEVTNDFVTKYGLDFEEGGGHYFHLSPSLKFTDTGHFVDGGIEFTRGTCARLKSD